MNYRKHIPGIGPGGVTCACCFPAPGSKARYRSAKRREKAQAMREAMVEV